MSYKLRVKRRAELLLLLRKHLMEAIRLGSRDFISPYIDIDIYAKHIHGSDGRRYIYRGRGAALGPVHDAWHTEAAFEDRCLALAQ